MHKKADNARIIPKRMQLSILRSYLGRAEHESFCKRPVVEAMKKTVSLEKESDPSILTFTSRHSLLRSNFQFSLVGEEAGGCTHEGLEEAIVDGAGAVVRNCNANKGFSGESFHTLSSSRPDVASEKGCEA